MNCLKAFISDKLTQNPEITTFHGSKIVLFLSFAGMTNHALLKFIIQTHKFNVTNNFWIAIINIITIKINIMKGYVEILQLRTKCQTAMMTCSRFI